MESLDAGHIIRESSMAVDGKWEIVINSPMGAQKATLDLASNGAALTGTQQAAQGSGPLENGKVDGNNVSFETKMEMQGNTRITKYEGTLAGDELKLKVTREGQNGPQTNEVTAKRATS